MTRMKSASYYSQRVMMTMKYLQRLVMMLTVRKLTMEILKKVTGFIIRPKNSVYF
jgi:hypothetical protein